MDYKRLDQKWQQAWDEARLFEGDVSGRESYMVTVAFPYVNSPQHIGHMRSYGTADVLARYKRMKGLNVLFPMGFHATGTPILAFAKRLRNNDADLIKELKLFHISDADIAKMVDPLYIANYFVKEIEYGMHRAGYSIDWRRKFVSIDPFFSKFVEWQFGILNSKGYIVKGKHPVGWCPNENNPVGMHDTKKDVEPDIVKLLAVKFKVEGEDNSMICCTFRQETLFGATNLFVNENAQYVLCNIDGATYYASKAAANALGYQFKVDVISEVSGKDLLAKKCVNPASGAVIPVLPGFFVEESYGTGIVMSVPAHAPFDYVALQKLKAEGRAPEIKPISVLSIPSTTQSQFTKFKDSQSYMDMPALAYTEMFKGTMAENEALEAATKLQYKEESHYGKMTIPGYEGMSEPEAREKITADLIAKGNAFDMHVLTNSPVYCRCGAAVVIKIVDNQWFLNYGNAEWKGVAKDAFAAMTILPEKSKKAFEAAIDWIDLRAVARSQGLGTPFPLDTTKIIESLSDSTIYMAFYTISLFIRDVPTEKLTPEFFDYVFLNKGDLTAVSQHTGVEYETIKRCRESFDYWYRRTSRHSGPDLIFNHLTMYIFNNSTIFAKEYWPKQIVVNGSVLSEGEKMSKSLGNIVPLVDALDKFGADVVRTMVIAGADLFSDSEFSEDAAKGISDRLEYLYELTTGLNAMEGSELRHIDYWLYSKLNRKIKTVTEQIEKLELRGVSTGTVYDSILELKRYLSRGTPNGIVLKDYMSSLALMMAPIAPHYAEEIWHLLGNDSFAATERWPAPEEEMISDRIEGEEALLEEIIDDTRQIMQLMKKSGKEPKGVKLIVADDWKRGVSNRLHQTRNIGEVMKLLNTEDGLKELGVPSEAKEKAIAYTQKAAKKLNAVRSSESTQEDEFKLLTEANQYISDALKCSVAVEMESKSASQRAANATPMRPSIDVSA